MSKHFGSLRLVWVLIATCLFRPGVSLAGSPWTGFALNAQHTATSPTGVQPQNKILWSTSVDSDPIATGGTLGIHYGSPVITAANTMIVPVKTSADGTFAVEALNHVGGVPIWSYISDYVLPPHGWIEPFGITLAPGPLLYFPGAGGTVFSENHPDTACPKQKKCVKRLAFYGIRKYNGQRRAFDANLQISTPLTSDSAGNLYFGFVVSGQSVSPILRDSHHRELSSGIARIDATGKGSWIAASTAAGGDASIIQVQLNCAPALSNDGKMIYVVVSGGTLGYLVALDSTTLTPLSKVRLTDPQSGRDAFLDSDSSSTPTVGPDGDVYYGVLENPIRANHERGWLLHFDSQLSTVKTPGLFGWDTTASVVPAGSVPSYTGGSSYLLVTKYNDYVEGGGTGQNKVALLDPNATELDPLDSNVHVMNEVATILGPTADPDKGGVKEWCINSAAVDPVGEAVMANSEDGKLYRWNIGATNPSDPSSLSAGIMLTQGADEAYTPTLIGPDGTSYAINNAILFAVGQ